MSYILDALRRADSERERGAVPSIHSPPVPPVADDPKPRRGHRQSQVLVGVIVVLLLALAGLLAWHLMSGRQAAPVVAVPASAVVVRAPEPPAAQAVSPPPPVALAPVPQQPAPVAAPPVPVQTPPAQAAPSPPPQAPAPMAAAPILSVPPRSAPVAAPGPRTVPAAEVDNRIHTLSELPPHIQRELPKLVIGGAMYSDTPAKRMLILNSQVFHEGDQLTPDLVLQEIRLKSAVLRYKGYRYGVNY